MKLTKIIFLLISAFLTGSILGCNPSAKKILIKGDKYGLTMLLILLKAYVIIRFPKALKKEISTLWKPILN